MKRKMPDFFRDILCGGMWPVPLAMLVSGLVMILLFAAEKPATQTAEKLPAPPAQVRSLEKIDQWNWHTFGGSGVYLFRITTCYYVVAFGDNSVAVTHLASCPSPEHRKTLPTGWYIQPHSDQVRPGDPIVGRPYGGVPFGVILEDEVKRRKDK